MSAAVLKSSNSSSNSSDQDFFVADLGLADWGRKEIKIAETEMPGLMAIREEFASQQPLKGAHITGSLHMTIQTAVLIQTLEALGAQVRWASCNIYSTQDHAAAAITANDTPVFAVKGETLDEYWDYTHRIFEWPNGAYSNMILDDGGDATLLLHLGARAEKDASVLNNPDSEEAVCLFNSIKKKLATDPTWYSTRLALIKGVTEETTPGVHRLYQMHMEGYRVVTMEYAAEHGDNCVTATVNYHVITHEHMKKMKDQAIVCNICHFDNEIEVAALRQHTWENIKPQVDHVIFPDGKRIILLAEGRLVNLGCGTGHPSYVMSSSFANQTIGQIELFTNTKAYPVGVYTLPKHLDEKVARLQLKKLNAQVTELTDEQANYIGVQKTGPYKPEHYRY